MDEDAASQPRNGRAAQQLVAGGCDPRALLFSTPGEDVGVMLRTDQEAVAATPLRRSGALRYRGGYSALLGVRGGGA